MKTDKLEKYLDELSDGTDFDFRISEIKNSEVELYMQGDNPCPWSDNRYLDIVICNKCALLHKHHLKYWDTKK